MVLGLLDNDDVRLTVVWGEDDDWPKKHLWETDIRLHMEYVRLGW